MACALERAPSTSPSNPLRAHRTLGGLPLALRLARELAPDAAAFTDHVDEPQVCEGRHRLALLVAKLLKRRSLRLALCRERVELNLQGVRVRVKVKVSVKEDFPSSLQLARLVLLLPSALHLSSSIPNLLHGVAVDQVCNGLALLLALYRECVELELRKGAGEWEWRW